MTIRGAAEIRGREGHAGDGWTGPVPRKIEVRVHGRRGLEACLPRLEAYAAAARPLEMPLVTSPAWLRVIERGLGHEPYALEAVEGGETRGILALALVSSLVFGRFLVSLPYLNSGGVLADDDRVAGRLIDRAVLLAEQLDVRHLELRHEQAIEHAALSTRAGAKVHMRLTLSSTPEGLWGGLSAKVRNQVRKGQKSGLSVSWGGRDLLPGFYDVFSRNMRDLGTPVYGRELFSQALRQFPEGAEICLVRAADRAIAAAFVLHGRGVSEVPSASSLRRYNDTNCNMLMYWSLLERAVGLRQATFDFGRSTPDGNTYRFKKQWGAVPWPAEWQYHVRRGGEGDMRPENPRYQRFIRIWKRLPVGLTRMIGPAIVRGIP